MFSSFEVSGDFDINLFNGLITTEMVTCVEKKKKGRPLKYVRSITKLLFGKEEFYCKTDLCLGIPSEVMFSTILEGF